MKEYLKKLIFRIVILILIIIGLLLIFETFSKVLESKNQLNLWYEENDIINEMNRGKLQNKMWHSNPIWLHEGESISPKKEGVKRILIVGDSFIWGDGYSNANHIWWQQFKLMLKQQGYTNVEVVAAGLSGFSTKQELDNIIKNEELMNNIDPDLIIFGYVSNDPEFRNDDTSVSVDAIDSKDLFVNHHNFLTEGIKKNFPYTYRNFSELVTNKFENDPNFEKIFGLNYYHWLKEISSGSWLLKYENEVIKPLTEYFDNTLNIPYFFFFTAVFPGAGDENIKNLFDKYNIKNYSISELLLENNIEVLDYYPNRMINPVNYHPSVYDCKLFAEMLFNVLESDYKNMLGTNSGSYNATLNINDWMPFSINLKKLNSNNYQITYPNVSEEKSFLYLPILKKYIKLNLEEPSDIKNIVITGNNIEEIELFVNYLDPVLNYDTQEMVSLGVRKESFVWEIDNYSKITSINISAKIKGGLSQDLSIYIE